MNRISTDSPSTSEPAPATSEFDLLGVLRSLWQWRRPILYVSAAAAIGSLIISLLLPVYYQAETSFLAINPDQANPDIISGTIASKTPLYGNMNDIDRLMAIAESNELVDYLVDEFGLYEHYDIDSTNLKASVKVRRKFRGLYEVTKTPQDAILIEVEDTDPELAAQLANAARQRLDHISKNLIRQALGKTVEVMRRDVENQQNILLGMADSLRILRETYAIFDLETQTEVLTTRSNQIRQRLTSVEAKLAAYRDSRLRGARDSVAKLGVERQGLRSVQASLDSQLALVSIGMEPILAIVEGRTSLSELHNEAKQRLEQFQNAMQSDLSLIATLETAQPPVIKSRPKRSLVVVGATFVAFLLSVLGVLAIENGRRYDWKKITD